MLNTVPAVAVARQPRVIVRVAGTLLPAVVSWEVDNNDYYEADTFRVALAVSKLPTANDANWFSSQTEIFLEVLAGFPSNPNAPDASELTSLIYGRVDDIAYDPVATLIHLTGRDLTAVFIDNKLANQYQNQTASAAVEAIAGAHGIAMEVTETSTLIGTYFANEQVRIQANRSEWDFIAWLAREEGFVAYMQGQTLYFGEDPRIGADAYEIQWQPPGSSGGPPSANVTELSFSRSLTVAKGITVTVRSRSLISNTPVVQSYPIGAKTIKPGASSPFGSTQNYFFNARAGLTPVQAQQYAEARYNEIVSHAMKLSARLPADLILSVSTPISVSGTGTAFDQTYYPRSVKRSMSNDEGFVMQVEAQNTTPELEEAAAPL
jgi:hypothetical protein